MKKEECGKERQRWDRHPIQATSLCLCLLHELVQNYQLVMKGPEFVGNQ